MFSTDDARRPGACWAECLRNLSEWLFTVLPSGSIATADKQLLECCGVTPEAVQSWSLWDFLPPLESEELRSQLEHALAGGIPWKADLRKEERFFSVTIYPSGHDCSFVIARDETRTILAERMRRAEHAVTRALSRARSVEEAAPDLLRVVGECIEAAVGRLWLVEDDVLVCRELAILEDDSRLADTLEPWRDLVLGQGEALPGRVWETRQPSHVPQLARDLDGANLFAASREGLASAIAFPILIEDRVLGVLEFFARHPLRPGPELLDVMAVIGSEIGRFIQRWRAEREIRRSELRKGAVLESALDAVILIDREGRIVDFNSAAESIFGYGSAEALGRRLTELIIPERYRQTHGAGLERFLRTGEQAILNRRLELTAVRSNGEEFPVELAVIHTPFEEGDSFFTGYLRDITGRIAIQRELEVTRDDALRATRAKSAFLANMSHEIRTPIASILGILELLDDTDLTLEQRVHLGTIRHSSRGLLAIIQDILDLSRIEAGRLFLKAAPFDLAETVARAVDLLRRQAQVKGLELSTWMSSVPRWVRGDSDRIHQVLVNLVGNAVKFTDAGGVSVKVAPAGADRVRFEVTDTGVGIRAEDQARLFAPFTQLDDSAARAVGGTGLGLSIVKRVVEQMLGEVGLTSCYGAGSTFWFEVPLPPAKAPASPLPPEGEAPPLGEMRVLIAEDNPVNRSVLKMQLEKLGVSPDVVNDGEQLLQQVRDHDYDLILMDCQMPRVDGYQAAREIRRSSLPVRNAPIVAVTAHVMEGEKLRCLEAGMNDYLCKPVASEDLRKVLRRWGPRTGRSA
ncbi:MAG: response regulator [Armatimonadetes bacterium]|nr:response regulator [Armatimonadota bacterium]